MYLIRELTKKYEQSYRGLPKEILEALQESPAKGEFVLIISGSY
jgi:16S rRNA C1402 (ribose-2'-O) methylase RsmI